MWGRQCWKGLGYQVLTSRSGDEALDVFAKFKDDIDLVILDMIMPGMDGGKTYTLLKKIDTGVRVLLSSGYSINAQAKAIMDRGCKGFIQKPFSLKTLSFKIREVLGKSR